MLDEDSDRFVLRSLAGEARDIVEKSRCPREAGQAEVWVSLGVSPSQSCPFGGQRRGRGQVHAKSTLALQYAAVELSVPVENRRWPGMTCVCARRSAVTGSFEVTREENEQQRRTGNDRLVGW